MSLEPPIHSEGTPAHSLFACIWLILLVLAGLFSILIALSTPETAFGINASTEWMELVAGGPKGLDWNVSGFELEACDHRGGTVQRLTLPDEAELLVQKGVVADFEKREGSPDVRIDLKRPPTVGGSEAGLCDGPTQVLISAADHTWRPLYGGHAILTFHHSLQHGGPWLSSPRVLELRGAVTAGQTPRVGSDAMLLGGEIDLHATHEHSFASRIFSRFAGERTYLADNLTLHRGDVIVSPPVADRGDEQPDAQDARGYVRIPATDTLQIGYFVSADQIVLQRAGNATVTLKLSAWSRIRNEPALTWGLGALLLLVTTSGLAPALANAWHLLKGRRRKP